MSRRKKHTIVVTDNDIIWPGEDVPVVYEQPQIETKPHSGCEPFGDSGKEWTTADREVSGPAARKMRKQGMTTRLDFESDMTPRAVWAYPEDHKPTKRSKRRGCTSGYGDR